MPKFPVYCAVVGSLVLGVVACSSASSSSGFVPTGDGGSAAPGTGGEGEGEGEGDASAAEAGAKTGKGPFDLTLTVRSVDGAGKALENLLFVTVRDAETKEIVASVHDDENVVSRVKIAKKASLEKGHRYEIGVKDTWFAGCLEPDANVWYREIPEVTDHVTLDFGVTAEVDEDPRGCDVLHAPVALPPGTYTSPPNINGVNGNRVTLIVSPTGRVYAKDLTLFCAAPSGCVPTTLTHGTCEWETAVYPGESTFRLVNASGNSTSAEGTATIDPATKTIRYTGRTKTWKSSGTVCCDDAFDVTLTKASATTSGCQ